MHASPMRLDIAYIYELGSFANLNKFPNINNRREKQEEKKTVAGL